MFVLNAYFCRELRFIAILRSKLRFLLRYSEVDIVYLVSEENLAGGVSAPLELTFIKELVKPPYIGYLQPLDLPLGNVPFLSTGH